MTNEKFIVDITLYVDAWMRSGVKKRILELAGEVEKDIRETYGMHDPGQVKRAASVLMRCGAEKIKEELADGTIVQLKKLDAVGVVPFPIGDLENEIWFYAEANVTFYMERELAKFMARAEDQCDGNALKVVGYPMLGLLAKARGVSMKQLQEATSAKSQRAISARLKGATRSGFKLADMYSIHIRYFSDLPVRDVFDIGVDRENCFADMCAAAEADHDAVCYLRSKIT